MFKFLGSSNRKLNQDYVIAAADKVPLSQKLGYGLGTFIDMWGHWLYPNIAFVVFGVFLAVPPWQIGVAVILNRLFDAIADPFFGWLSDNSRTRWGRRRPFILVGGVLAGIFLPMLVWVSPGWGNTTIFGHEISNYFWFMIGSSALYLPIVSCCNMPFVSLGNELTPDYHERTTVFSIKKAVQLVPEVGLFFAGKFFSFSVWVGATSEDVWVRIKRLLTDGSAWAPAADGEKPNMLLGAQVYCTILGAIMVVAAIGLFLTVKERYYGKLVAGKQEKISIAETLWQTLSCKPFRIQLCMNLAYNLGLSMVGTLGYAVTIYYVSRGNVSEGNSWNFIMGLSGMVMGFMGLPVYAAIARNFGKRHGMMAVLGSAFLVFLATWFLYTPKIVWLQIFASGLIAFTSAGFWTLTGSIGADVIDYDELENGRRREGAFSACGSWINKFGMAIGAGISFFILGWVGFDSKLDHQSEHTLFMIRLLLMLIPLIGLTIAFIAVSRFPLSQERVMEIRAQLEARRGKV